MIGKAVKQLTEFEKKVYRVVLSIPAGETRTYKWVAEKVGHPKAYQAVGRALNKNPYPVLIPCHRVIRSDGKLGGYKEGKETKKKLLEQEGAWKGRCKEKEKIKKV